MKQFCSLGLQRLRIIGREERTVGTSGRLRVFEDIAKEGSSLRQHRVLEEHDRRSGSITLFFLFSLVPLNPRALSLLSVVPTYLPLEYR